MTLTVGSLFTGIGGLDLGCERAGMRIAWQSEIDPYACQVLAKHWPDTPNLGDITQVDWATVEPVDVICGGYPCQPFSLAGARQGTNDARHLWPYFANAIRVLRPRYALLENVAGHLSLGFDTVLGDLAACGYDAQWDCIPAAAVGAPHLRDRLFVICTRRHDVSHTNRGRVLELAAHPRNGREVQSQEPQRIVYRSNECRDVADANGKRCEKHGRTIATTPEQSALERDGSNVAHTDRTPRRAARRASKTLFRPETLERFRRRSSSNGGHTWAVEPDVGRVAHGIPRRVDRLRALGNAVVPQVAQYIAELIVAHAEETHP